MRTRVFATLTAVVLALSACQPTAVPSGSGTAPSGPAASSSAPAGSASAPAGSPADTLQMHWLGDLTAIWHPAS